MYMATASSTSQPLLHHHSTASPATVQDSINGKPSSVGPSLSNHGKARSEEQAGTRRRLPQPPPPPPRLFGLASRPRAIRDTGVQLNETSGLTRVPPPPPPPLPLLTPDAIPKRPSRESSSAVAPLPPPPPPPSRNNRDVQQTMPRRVPPLVQPPASSSPYYYPGSETRNKPPRSPSRHLQSQSQPVHRPSPTSSSCSSYSREDDSSRSGRSISEDEAEDLYTHWNHWFPPLMPTVGSQSSIARTRKLVTKKITNRVSRYEQHGTSSDHSNTPDSTSESSEDGAQLLWVQLKEKRQRLDETRQDMGSRRKKLRELRRQKDEADNAFMGLLRPILTKNRRGIPSTSDELLDRRFIDMQKLRTEYHYLESAYEGLEVALDEQEEDLNKLEVRFFSLLATGRTGSARARTHDILLDSDTDVQQPTIPYILLGISADGPANDVHPLWLELVSAIGDFNLAQEELDDLLFRREQVAYELELKKNMNKTASEEEAEFMAEFPAEEREKRQRAEDMADEMHRLQLICRATGAEKKHPSFKVAYALDRNVGEDMTLSDAWPESKSLSHHRFPELLSQPDHVLRSPEPLTALGDLKQAHNLPAHSATKKQRMDNAMKEYGIHQLIHGLRGDRKGEAEAEGDLVTRWLMYQLRTNPLEAHLLHNTFSHKTNLKVLDYRSWARDVLRQWWGDGTEDHCTADQTVDTRSNLSLRGHDRSPSVSRPASEPFEDERTRPPSDLDSTATF